MTPKLTNRVRAEIATEWKRSGLTQVEFCRNLRERGLVVSTRSLRLWVETFCGRHSEALHVERARELLVAARDRVQELLDQLKVLIADVDARMVPDGKPAGLRDAPVAHVGGVGPPILPAPAGDKPAAASSPEAPATAAPGPRPMPRWDWNTLI